MDSLDVNVYDCSLHIPDTAIVRPTPTYIQYCYVSTHEIRRMYDALQHNSSVLVDIGIGPCLQWNCTLPLIDSVYKTIVATYGDRVTVRISLVIEPWQLARVVLHRWEYVNEVWYRVMRRLGGDEEVKLRLDISAHPLPISHCSSFSIMNGAGQRRI